MSITSLSPSATVLTGAVRNVAAQSTSSSRKKKLSQEKPSYPGMSPDGAYVGEVYLTWFFGRGPTMWRERFDSQEAAKHAAHTQARYLDDELPTTYWAEDWRGRPYRERHEYGISWNVVLAEGRAPEDLVIVSLTHLPGEQQ